MTIPLLFAGLVLCGSLIWLLETLIVREDVAAGLIFALIVLSAALTSNMPSLSVADIRIGPSDVFYGLLAAAAMARYLRLRRYAPAQRALVILALLCLVSLAIGAVTGSIPSAVNDFRQYLQIVGAALYFSTMSLDSAIRARLGTVWLFAGGAMAVLIGLRWAGRFGGISIGILDATYDATIRVLDGPETLFVATAAIIALLPSIAGLKRRRWVLRLGIVLFLMVIVLNRRTVWVALGVALVALLLRNPSVGRRAAWAAVAGLMVFTLAVPFLPGSAGEDRPVTQTATNTGTLVWRLEGWTSLLDTVPQTVTGYAIGLPFGSGYEREVQGRELITSPHSFYLQTFLRVGLLGLGAMLLAMWLGLSATASRAQSSGELLSPEALFLLLLMQGVWYLTWQPGAEQGIVLGLIVATASQDWWTGRPIVGRPTLRVSSDTGSKPPPGLRT